jgi:hypothetical protein
MRARRTIGTLGPDDVNVVVGIDGNPADVCPSLTARPDWLRLRGLDHVCVLFVYLAK